MLASYNSDLLLIPDNMTLRAEYIYHTRDLKFPKGNSIYQNMFQGIKFLHTCVTALFGPSVACSFTKMLDNLDMFAGNWCMEIQAC